MILFLCGLSAWAEPTPESLLPQSHPFHTCATCHGVKGEGNETLKSPRLVGQKTSYLKHQLIAFQKGWRGEGVQDIQGKLMATAIQPLSQEKLEEALAYLETLEVAPPVVHKNKISLDRGRYLYERNCLICHGEAGEGSEVEPLVPRLDIQHGWYMEAQLKKFRARLRGFHPDDAMGESMAFYAKLIPDDQAVQEIVAWIQQSAKQKRKREEMLGN